MNASRRESGNRGRDILDALYDTSLQNKEIGGVTPPANEWAISSPMAQFLFRLVVRLGRRRILEFGAGSSSLVFATALARAGGGRLTSVEHQPEFCSGAWKRVEQIGSVDAKLLVSPLRLRMSRHGLMHGYPAARRGLADRGPYDVVLIDAPPGRYGRDAPLYDAYPMLADGAIVILDDAGRAAEQTTVRRWLRTFPALQLLVLDESVSERGTAILVHSGSRRARFAPRAILGTVHDRLIELKGQP